MREPTAAERTLLTNAMGIRGSILTSYAQIEFLLADMGIRASFRFSEYEEMRGKRFPFPLSKRIVRIREILASSGPLKKYADRLDPLVDGLLSFTDLRDYMAHGFFEIGRDDGNDPEDRVLIFRLYNVEKGGDLKLWFFELSVRDLKRKANELTAYAQKMMVLAREIYIGEDLQSVSGLPGNYPDGTPS